MTKLSTVCAFLFLSASFLSNIGCGRSDLKKPGTIKVTVPALSPEGGTFNADTDVTITCSTDGAAIYYTTDGSTSFASATQYAGPVSIEGSGTSITINAIAVKDGMDNSEIATGDYIIDYDDIAVPILTPAGGTHDTDIEVTVTCDTADVLVYYTTDGSAALVNATEYTGPITVSGSGTEMTINVIAVKASMDFSTASEDYIIDYPNARYIDPSAATSGDGSLASPYNTWIDVTFEPGHYFLQKRGTIVREQITIDVSGDAGNIITIGAYGEGDLPIVNGAEIETGWELTGGNIYEKQISDLEADEGLGIVLEDGDPLGFVPFDENSPTLANRLGRMVQGSFFYDHTTDTVYVWCTDSADPDTHVMGVSRRYFGVYGDSLEYITVQNLNVMAVSRHGVFFLNGSNIAVKDCIIEKLGGNVVAVLGVSPYVIPAGNGIEFGNSSSNCTVQNCLIQKIFDSGISPQTYADNQTASNFTFSDCIIRRCGFAGIEIAVLDVGSTTGCSISNIDVQNVDILYSGKGWSGIRWNVEGRGIKVDGGVGVGVISGVNIEECLIFGAAGEGIYLGGDAGTVEIKKCDITNNNLDGIQVSSTGTDIACTLSSSLIRNNGSNDGAENRSGFSYNVPSGDGFNIYNNTFYDNAWIGAVMWNHSGDANMMNNIFHASTSRYHFATGYTVAIADFRNNYFAEFGPAAIIGYDILGTPAVYIDADGFNTDYNFANDNISDNAPLLTDATNDDFTIQSTSSPCYHTGVAVADVTDDYDGNPFNNPPSMGALEFVE